MLNLTSAGADKRFETEDDFSTARFSWPYFRPVGEKINRAVAEYHARTGGHIRDAATLKDELHREGLNFETLRDRWGQPYVASFGISGTCYTIMVNSGGPNRRFEPDAKLTTDDFTIWTTLSDYFAERRAAIDVSLTKNLRATNGFPRTEAAFREALARHDIRFESLSDAWGNSLHANFKTETHYADRITLESRGTHNAGEAKQRTEIKPVSQTVHIITLHSDGADGKRDTPDDFIAGYFTSVAAEQTARDRSPQAVNSATTFSGATGAISGTVTDPNGAVISGAKVTATHMYASLQFMTMSDDEGHYILRHLPSGFYRLSIEAPGFVVTVIDGTQVQSLNLINLNTTLEIGTVAETVEVSAGSMPQIQTLSADASAKITKQAGTAKPPLSTPRLREYFPETLVWQPLVETDREGRARVRFKLADNITTWKMSVIGSSLDGKIGVVEKEIRAFQPFFVEHDPPRVLTEGDEIQLPVVLRNYLDRRQIVDLTIKPESWFTLLGAERQRADAPAGDSTRETFGFRAVSSVKDGRQRITAAGTEASDAIEKPVTVHPDGEEIAQTAGDVFGEVTTLDVPFPSNVLPGTARAELKIYPNLTAHVIEGIEGIMQRPYGCGEQTISSAYPSLLLLRHYKIANRGAATTALPAIAARAERYVRIGYERLLGYRTPDGGFSYWGRGAADLALTAYALRFLSDARHVIAVDEDVIEETRVWLVKQQRADGGWAAKHWSGESSDRHAALLTAFIARVLAASESPRKSPSNTNDSLQQKTSVPLRNALGFLARRVAEIDEPYLLASYALAAFDSGEHANARRAVEKLRALAHDEGTGSYWSLETNTPFYGWGLAGRVETTALVVQALARGGQDVMSVNDEQLTAPATMPTTATRNTDALINRGLLFLLRNKDRYGVWYSTQATVNVLDALIALTRHRTTAGATDDKPITLGQSKDGGTIEVIVNDRRAASIALPPAGQETGLLAVDLTPHLTAPGANRVELRRAGGSAIDSQTQAQIVSNFYVPWKQPADGDVRSTRKIVNSSALEFSVSFDKTGAAPTEEITCRVSAARVGHSGYGMLLAEIGLPPGADVDRASLERAMKESGWSISQYDVLPDRLVVYLWPQGGGTGFEFKFRPRFGLRAQSAASVLYDYYNPEARVTLGPTKFVVR